MNAAAQSEAPAAEVSILERDTDTAIAACDGDARQAVRVLLVENAFLHSELERIKEAVSRGYLRSSSVMDG
jgi:hypothetical protein